MYEYTRPNHTSRRGAIRRALSVQRSTPRPRFVLGLLLISALFLWVLTAVRVGAFEYLEIPDNCQVIDELNPFPDISEWNLVEDKEMGLMEDNAVTMCRRKTFAAEDSNRKLFVVYFKDEPTYYWYYDPEGEGGPREAETMDKLFGGGGKPKDPTAASDYREQSKRNFDVDFGFLEF